MALIKCMSCGRDISDKAKKCPGCGWIPGSKIEEVISDERETNSQNLELEITRQRNKQLENEISKLKDKISELNNGTQEIGSLKKLIIKLNNEKSALEKQLEEMDGREPTVIDKTDYESIQKLQNENRALQNDNQRLQKENADLVNINEKQISSNNSDMPINIVIKRKDLILGLIGILIIFTVAFCALGVVTKSMLKKEFSNIDFKTEVSNQEQIINDGESENDNETSIANEMIEQPSEKIETDNGANKKAIEVMPFELKEDGYKPGDVICEINGVSIVYDSCEITDETTSFLFRCINNGDETYEVRMKNIAINRVMLEDSFHTDEITAGNQGKLEFYYGNEYLLEECGKFQEMNLTIDIRNESFSVVGSMDGIYLYP